MQHRKLDQSTPTEREIASLKRACKTLERRVEETLGADGVHVRQSQEWARALRTLRASLNGLEDLERHTPLPTHANAVKSIALSLIELDCGDGRLREPRDGLAAPGLKTREVEGASRFGYEGARVLLRGRSEGIGVPELILFLQAQRSSGLLRVDLERESIYLEFDNGELVFAMSSDPPPEMVLGEILVRRGTITHHRLRDFLQQQKGSRVRLGRSLLAAELVSRMELQEALEEQVQALFHRLYASGPASYSLSQLESSQRDGLVDLNVAQLLLQSASVCEEGQSPEPAF